MTTASAQPSVLSPSPSGSGLHPMVQEAARHAKMALKTPARPTTIEHAIFTAVPAPVGIHPGPIWKF